MKHLGWKLLAVGAVAGGAAIAAFSGGQAQSASGPKARYYLDATTLSGFMGNPMAAMLGRGGSSERRELRLRLGSTLAPTGGAAKADHFMPDGMRLGPSVPLYTPQRGTPDTPGEYKMPKSRLLIYWGCGAKAGPGQPIVIDFAKLAAGQVPPGLFSTTVPMETPVNLTNSRTYGEWPNAMDRKPKQLQSNSSLIGDHRVAGNYAPEINFTLQRDFMAGLHARSQGAPDGSTMLSWTPITNATGYYAFVMGGKSLGEDAAEMVWWTSASRKEFGGGLSDWLSPATVSRLITQKIVMPPAQTNCQVPAEVKQAAGGMMMGFMYAYGPEQDFAYPPRPANPKTPWHIEWTAKARFRAMTTVMLGMPNMGDMSRMEDAADEPRKEKPKKCKPGIGGLLSGALGGRVC